MKSSFRKISRVGSLTGAIKWYLSEDCLLAAKRVMYAVEYRRFYLRDLESIVVWPSQRWRFRFIPGIVMAFLGAYLWEFVNSTAGEIFVGLALAWLALEAALGPTAKSHIRATGVSVDLPVVRRTRRARRVLAKIDAAVRAARSAVEQPAVPPATIPSISQSNLQTSPETSATTSTAAVLQTNGS